MFLFISEEKHFDKKMKKNDAKFSFVEHINEKVKAYRIIGTLRFLSQYLPLHSLHQIYQTMIALTWTALWRTLSYSPWPCISFYFE